MGSADSKQKNFESVAQYGGIYLKSDKDRYHPGDQFTGIIHLNLLKNYPGDSISLQVKCTEKWMHAYKRQANKRTHYELPWDKVSIMNIRIPVYKNNGEELQLGQYSFPISFLIPQNIPGSLYHEGNGFVTSVEFKVKAIVNTFESKAPKLYYKENLIIEEYRQHMDKPLQKRESIPLTICCCCNYGLTSLSLDLEKDALMPGETTSMKFYVDNSQSKLSFFSVRCELIEEVVLGNRRFTFSHNTVAVDLPGIAELSPMQDKVIKLTLPPYNPSTTKFKHLPIKKYDFDAVYGMRYQPNELIPSITGSSVKVQFYLAVELLYDGCHCCFENPIINIPIQVYIPPFTLNSTVEVPADWNPKIMPILNGLFNKPASTTAVTNSQEKSILKEMDLSSNTMKNQPNFDENTFGKPELELQKY